MKNCPFCNCDEMSTPRGKVVCDLCGATTKHKGQWEQRPTEEALLASIKELKSLFEDGIMEDRGFSYNIDPIAMGLIEEEFDKWK